MMTDKPKRTRKRARGVVKSDKMDKTVTVVVGRLVRDRRYGKYIRRKTTFAAHDPHNDAREGDLVEIESTRPLSKTKRWRVVRIVRRAAVPEPAVAALSAPQEVVAESEPEAQA